MTNKVLMIGFSLAKNCWVAETKLEFSRLHNIYNFHCKEILIIDDKLFKFIINFHDKIDADENTTWYRIA